MKTLIISMLLIACQLLTACSNDDEPVAAQNIVGVWNLQYPEGLQTEGFTEWNFKETGTLEIRVYDVFSGDHTCEYDYELSGEKSTVTISGNLRNQAGETVHDVFAIYEVVKLSKKALSIRQSWVNPGYEDLEPEDKNSFLLGSYKEETFRRSK